MGLEEKKKSSKRAKTEHRDTGDDSMQVGVGIGGGSAPAAEGLDEDDARADAAIAEEIQLETFGADTAEDLEKDRQISFKYPEDIAKALDTRNTDLLIQGFMHLREHLKICSRLPSSNSGDASNVSAERRALCEQSRRVVYLWAEGSDGFSAVESAWQHAQTYSVTRLETLIPSVVSQLLIVLDGTETTKYGNRLVRMVLDRFMRSLYRTFNTPRTSACATALQLLYQIVVFSHGEHADEVRHAFDWTMKAVELLPTIRSSAVGFSIRRLWIRFVLAFFSVERCRSYTELFRARRLISNLFLNAGKDSYQELHTLLSSVYQYIVLNEGIGRAEKVRMFGEQLVGNLARMAKSKELVDTPSVGIAQAADFVPIAQENPTPITQDSKAALVDRFLRGMMTYPGHGICFTQYGLYPAPRQAGQADESKVHTVARFSRGGAYSGLQELCNGQILRVLISAINPGATRRMSELTVDVLQTSPELIAPYWRSFPGTLEPRLSLHLLGTTAFTTKVLDLPLPLPPKASDDPRFSEPPPVNTLAEHVWPLPLQRALVGRALQFRSSPLVRYRFLLLIDLALRKLSEARNWIASEMRQSGNAAGARWAALDRQLLALVRQRIPEWKIVRNVQLDIQTPEARGGDAEEAKHQYSLMNGAMMRVIEGIQRHFGDVILDASFDYGRLLVDINPLALQLQSQPMDTHALLHMLDALQLAPATYTKWMARIDDAEHSHLGTLLLVYLLAESPRVRIAARNVCVGALCASGLFDHDRSDREALAWLYALATVASPQATRSTRFKATEEQRNHAHELVSFLEAAVQHASKLPHKYADRIHGAIADMAGAELPFSPLLPAIVEAAILKTAVGSGALAAKLRGKDKAYITAVISTQPAYLLVRETACAIVEACGQYKAGPVAMYLSTAAEQALAPRAAKMEAGSDEQVHLQVVSAAFSEWQSGIGAYLSVLNGDIPAIYNASADGKPDGASKKAISSLDIAHLSAELDNLAADIGSRLDSFISLLSTTLSDCRVTARTLTLWLLSQVQASPPVRQQATLIACVRWITLTERVSADCSLWDVPEFVSVALLVLQIDDSSFLIALLRQLLVAHTARILENPAAQQLLVHSLLVSRGQQSLGGFVRPLLRRVLYSKEATVAEAAFVFSLAVAHIESLPPSSRSTMLAEYAAVTADLGRSISPDVELGLAFLARNTALKTIPSAGDASISAIWRPLVSRIQTKILSGNVNMQVLLLTRTAAPAIDSDSRALLARALGASDQDTSDVAYTVFSLLEGMDLSTELRALRDSLSTRIVSAWAKSQGSDRLLLRTALKATQPVGSNADSLAAHIDKTRDLLARTGSTLEPVDIRGLLDHLWSHTSSQSLFARDADARELLSRLLRADVRLRPAACEWVGSQLRLDKKPKGNCLKMLAWIVHVLACLSLRSSARGGYVFDADVQSMRMRELCLALGTCIAKREADLSDEDILFVASVYVQFSDDKSAICKLCSTESAATQSAAAKLLLSRAQRPGPAPEDTIDLLGETIELAARIIPDLQASVPVPEDTASVLADALLCIAQVAPEGSAGKPLADIVAQCFASIDSLTESLCLTFDSDAAHISAAEIESLSARIPAVVFRLISFAALAVHRITGQSSTPHQWFVLLRRIVGCRLFASRMQSPDMSQAVTLALGSLWTLSLPTLSRWSNSLSDFLTLDELESLVGAYSGTQSPSDLVLMHIISGYEAASGQSVQRAALAFGPTAWETYQKERLSRAQYLIERNENAVGEVGEDTVGNALVSIEVPRMQRSIVEFPVHAMFEPYDPVQALFNRVVGNSPHTHGTEANYDPRFILPWLWSLLSPKLTVDPRRLIESNAPSMAIVALSSAHQPTRRLAYYILDALYLKVFAASTAMQGGLRMCRLLLDSLRNAIVDRTETNFPQVPFTTALFAATSLAIMLQPGHTMFTEIVHTLLKQPFLILKKIPMVRSTLRATKNLRRRRVHVLRLAVQSAQAYDESQAWFRYSDITNILLALAANPLGDMLTSRSALTLMFHLTSRDNPKGLIDHVSKGRFSLLAWIRQQIVLELNSLVGAASQTRMEINTGNHDSSVQQGIQASVVNLTVLLRIVLRATANFPLTNVASGSVFNRFWVVQSLDQAVAPGQSAVLDLVMLVLDSVHKALRPLPKDLCESLLPYVLALLRTCVDSTQLLFSMQQKYGGYFFCHVQSRRIASSALAISKILEPFIALPSTTAVSQGGVALEDPCSALSVSQAKSFRAMFAVCKHSMKDYEMFIHSMVSWCLAASNKDVCAADYMGVVCRALVVKNPLASNVVHQARSGGKESGGEDLLSLFNNALSF
ncbi:hypothetical protein GGI07_001185 [Coemansia sp. Benny D115]|nr:hypothetical protein GGI07_001185 [Coemansia sp. Benny D115]